MIVDISWVYIIITLSTLAHWKPFTNWHYATLVERDPTINAKLCTSEVLGKQLVCFSKGERLEVAGGGVV